MKPLIIVQEIRDRWSKEERRREGTMRRKLALERALVPVHHRDTPGAQLLHHTFLLGNRRADVPPERAVFRLLERPYEVGGVIIDAQDEGVRVEFAYTPGCGAPNRWWAQKRFLLGLNEWAHITYNGRFSYDWTSYWYYEKTAVNVGWFDSLRPDVFSSSEPTHRYTLLSHLY